MISIIVPNFNSSHLLAKNLPELSKLLEKSKLDYEIIVTDDCSTDDSVSLIRSLPVKQGETLIKIVESSKNTGFGTNVDRGIRAAKGEIIFVLNAADALPESSDYFKIMLEDFKDPKVFSVGALKKETESHGCGEIYFEKGLFMHRRGNYENKLTAWADGGAQAIRKEYYEKIAGFDPLYKFYWEDVDLGFRAWKAGYKIVFEPKAVLIHKKEEGPIARIYSERSRRIMNLRNQLIFTWKNADFKHWILYELWEPYHLLIALKNRDWDFFVAYWQAFSNMQILIQKRFQQKRVTKLSDDKVLLMA